jgi:hypothetical protein
MIRLGYEVYRRDDDERDGSRNIGEDGEGKRSGRTKSDTCTSHETTVQRLEDIVMQSFPKILPPYHTSSIAHQRL